MSHLTVHPKVTQQCESTVLQLKKRAETVRNKAELREGWRLQMGIWPAQSKMSKREGRESSRTGRRAFQHYQEGKDKPAKESEQEWTRAKEEKVKSLEVCWSLESNQERNS